MILAIGGAATLAALPVQARDQQPAAAEPTKRCETRHVHMLGKLAKVEKVEYCYTERKVAATATPAVAEVGASTLASAPAR